MTLYSYSRVMWTDKRFTNLVSKGSEPLVLEDGAWKHVWTPHVSFASTLESIKHGTAFDHTLMTVSEGGKVYLVYQ